MKPKSSNYFNRAPFSTPKADPSIGSWWIRPEMQQDREQFAAMLKERASTVFAPSSVPLHKGQMK